MRKLRLVKVLVQPVFVLDDGAHISEIEHPTVAVPAAEWADYSERFAAECAAWQARLDQEDRGGRGCASGTMLPEFEPVDAMVRSA